MTAREAFEAWVYDQLRAEGYSDNQIRDIFMSVDHEDRYRDRSVSDAWRAWQAATKQAREAAFEEAERIEFDPLALDLDWDNSVDIAYGVLNEYADKIRSLKEGTQ